MLVEPDYRRNSRSIRARIRTEATLKKRDDESLWYPPTGLMKLGRFHKARGDEVHFVYGCGEKRELFGEDAPWDRIYITSLYTYHWDKILETIEHYKEVVWGDIEKVFVGGIMASLAHKDLAARTGVNVVKGVLNSPKQVGLSGDENIDLLPPDYSLLDSRVYAINDTYYAYTSRGCVNRCSWCGVPILEPEFIPYIDIRDTIRKLRMEYGDKPKLKLMDNNVMASPYLEKIVSDLIEMGYGRNSYTGTKPKKQRVVDFNQGLDASFFSEDKMSVLAALNIRPMRIAFDRIGERDEYVRAIEIAAKHGVRAFSNYMLYNFEDTPKDLYERLMTNIRLNDKWRAEGKPQASIYSYPMRYAPINNPDSPTDIGQEKGMSVQDMAKSASPSDYGGECWSERFVRNVEIMKGVAHGSISPTPSLARRTLGETYEEFLANLYMPEELLRNRNRYEKRVYEGEPKRRPGTGDIEGFRAFVSGLLSEKDSKFAQFHSIVSKNSRREIRRDMSECMDRTIKKWLAFYIK